MLNHLLSADQWEPGVQTLLECLNPWLIDHYQTCVLAARDEPYYSPRSESQRYHEIQFAHGYFNSALHELAHWCVAGEKRRLLPDFGYWYEPDGRTEAQQKLFESVEVKPQAIEWHFALACGREFRVSADNLSGDMTDSQPFKRAVKTQAEAYLSEGLPARAERLVGLLSTYFGVDRQQFEFLTLE